MEDNPGKLIPTRRSLILRQRDWDDQASWKDFFEAYWKLIYSVARKAGLNDAEAQDVVQESIYSVAQYIPDFRYDPALGSFKSWLMRITRSRIADHFRTKQFKRGGKRFPREQPMDPVQLEGFADLAGFNLEAAWEEEWERHTLAAALAKVRQSANPVQYQLFYLHVCEGVPAREVAASLGVKLAEVYFAKYKVEKLVKQEIQRKRDQMQ
jgi:RNA polymerase sigma-70 factor (ECF subfamily)